jgi:hypothetical protein
MAELFRQVRLQTVNILKLDCDSRTALEIAVSITLFSLIVSSNASQQKGYGN